MTKPFLVKGCLGFWIKGNTTDLTGSTGGSIVMGMGIFGLFGSGLGLEWGVEFWAFGGFDLDEKWEICV